MSDPTPEERKEAARWLGGAEEELAVARLVAGHPAETPGRAACFHAHLAAEKALKALLIVSGVEAPHSHDLGDLKSLLPSGRREPFDDADLQSLNPWAIDGRYPEDAPDVVASEVLRLVAIAQRVVGTVHEVFPDAKDGDEGE